MTPTPLTQGEFVVVAMVVVAGLAIALGYVWLRVSGDGSSEGDRK